MLLARLMDDDVAGTLRVVFGKVRCRRQYAVIQGQRRRRGFDRPRAAKHMPVHRFRGRNRRLVRSEHFLDGRAFHPVVCRGGGAVSIDVADGIRRKLSIRESRSHGAYGPFPGGLRQMMSVA